jgi:translation initiation factor eIF-2B subunit epsilon
MRFLCTQRMAPITTERPKVLLPLVNSPMIEYILEWLATSGVQQVHILCCSHADLIKQYLLNSPKWADGELEINIIPSYNCMSAGEALRLVDQEGIIKDDFILVSGDVVTNMNLQAALEAHKKRR